MIVNFKVWEKLFLEISNIIGAQVEIKKYPSLGLDSEFISGQMYLSYKQGLIRFIQSANKVDYENCSPSFLHLEYSYSNPNNFHIYLTQKDFFSKLFSGNKNTIGNKNFDKKFTISSNDKKLVLTLFEEERVQKLFLENPLLVFNVQTKKGETTIKFKSMAKKLYSKEEMLFFFEEYKFMLGKILN